MMTANTLKGNWGTLLLPVNEDNSIDHVRLSEEIDLLIAAGLDGIYSNGTAGEFHNQVEKEFDIVQMILADKCKTAGMPFQIGASHPSPWISLERVRRGVALQPDAFQIILPDWVTVTEEEQESFLKKIEEAADGIPLVLYNPPHAKQVLNPSDYMRLSRSFPSLIGIKTGAGDASWYREMRSYNPTLSVFVPGHALASGVKMGVASGAYSNVACLHPEGSQRWWQLIQTNIEEALLIQEKILMFFRQCIEPYKQAGYSNPALDKLLAAAGGWGNVGTRLRWPYKWIAQKEVEAVRSVAKRMLPELLGSVMVCVLMLLGMAGLHAEIKLPAVIGNNMVLQRESEVPLWGKARKHTRVTVLTGWDKKLYSVISDTGGAWKVMVKTPGAGGPYTIRCSDGDSLLLQNILIGEVWICSGQSNMEMPVKGFKNQPVLHSTDLLLDAGNPMIRLFRLERGMSRTPVSDCTATGWEGADATSVANFSAVGYQFAKRLQEQLHVPVGMIMPTWGGTVIEAWMDKKSLAEFPGTKIREAGDTAAMTKNEPTVLFNSMINPLLGYGMKGVIWYQGEQNRPNPRQYDKMMAAMVGEWRSLWGRGEWPFYYVQIAPYGYNDKLGPAAPVREAQARAQRLIPNSGMVVSMDAGEERSIHPADKTVVATRLVLWALANTYGRKGLPYASPVLRSTKVDKGGIECSFDNAPNGLTAFGKTLSAFEIAGEDKVFYPAKARITGNGVMVQSDSVKAPVAVRYAWRDWVIGDLFNTEGLPAGPFRTDDW